MTLFIEAVRFDIVRLALYILTMFIDAVRFDAVHREKSEQTYFTKDSVRLIKAAGRLYSNWILKFTNLSNDLRVSAEWL